MENKTAEMVKGMKYRVTAGFETDEMVYLGPDEINNPIWNLNGVSILIPWPAIDRLESLE